MGSTCVVGRDVIRNFTGVDLKPRREQRTRSKNLQLLPALKSELGRLPKKFYWFGERSPNQEEMWLLETVFYHCHNLVWPVGHQSCWLAPRRLVNHLQAVAAEDGDDDTYLLIQESGLAKYLANIRGRLTEQRLTCHFVALDNCDRLVAVYTHTTNTQGEGNFWRRWCLPPTRGELNSGLFRRPVSLDPPIF
ncbi:MAG: hypothetical protein Q7T49_03080 [bacterium]|nr:hypothetical protein [bacterium]